MVFGFEKLSLLFMNLVILESLSLEYEFSGTRLLFCLIERQLNN